MVIFCPLQYFVFLSCLLFIPVAISSLSLLFLFQFEVYVGYHEAFNQNLGKSKYNWQCLMTSCIGFCIGRPKPRFCNLWNKAYFLNLCCTNSHMLLPQAEMAVKYRFLPNSHPLPTLGLVSFLATCVLSSIWNSTEFSLWYRVGSVGYCEECVVPANVVVLAWHRCSDW